MYALQMKYLLQPAHETSLVSPSVQEIWIGAITAKENTEWITVIEQKFDTKNNHKKMLYKKIERGSSFISCVWGWIKN